MKYEIEISDYWSKIEPIKYNVIIPGGVASVYDKKLNRIYYYGGSSFNDQTNNQIIIQDLNNDDLFIHDILSIPDRFNHSMFLLNNNVLCIVGGTHVNVSDQPETVIIYFYNIKEKKISEFNTKIDFRKQLRATLDNKKENIYLYGGANKNDHYRISIKSKVVTEIKSFVEYSIVGPVYTMLPNDKIFIFSGFSCLENKSVCHNTIYLYDPIKETSELIELNEPFGRTFSKSIILEHLNKVLIFGGSMNGMEGSGNLYFYDYKNNIFNLAYIDSLPGERVEPTMVYSEKNNKAYIAGGLQPSGNNYKLINNIMVLDINELSEDTWLGHQ